MPLCLHRVHLIPHYALSWWLCLQDLNLPLEVYAELRPSSNCLYSIFWMYKTAHTCCILDLCSLLPTPHSPASPVVATPFFLATLNLESPIISLGVCIQPFEFPILLEFLQSSEPLLGIVMTPLILLVLLPSRSYTTDQSSCTEWAQNPLRDSYLTQNRNKCPWNDPQSPVSLSTVTSNFTLHSLAYHISHAQLLSQHIKPTQGWEPLLALCSLPGVHPPLCAHRHPCLSVPCLFFLTSLLRCCHSQ